jgi:ubiquinone/menaquinone biosynthesis C-methylase UbiE
MGKNALVDPAAFDEVAASYDDTFTSTDLGRMLRSRVWKHLSEQFQPGDHVLDLACGTGEDALWLAERGVRVTALDGSEAMTRIVTEKVNRQAQADMIRVSHCSLQDFSQGPSILFAGPDRSVDNYSNKEHGSSNPNGQLLVDGALSNFGGLNVIDEWRMLAASLAKVVRPGGRVVLVPMGRICPWEVGWFLLHGRIKKAFRRLGRGPDARIGDSVIPVRYPSPGRLKHDFETWFDQVHIESLGLLLPPSYLDHLVSRAPGFFERLGRIESGVGRFAPVWGDHFIQIFERKEAVLAT